MWDEIARLTQLEGLTILLTTHYLEEADKLAQRLAIVDKGLVVAEGAPEELKGEMRGDTITLQFAEPPSADLVRETLTRVPGVTEVATDTRVVRARADEGASALPLVIANLEDVGIVAQSVTVARPSLDDVYLRYAGRAFAQADSEAGSSPGSPAGSEAKR
jgi:ABC-2 type transport system ATP-binding protein